MTIDALATAGSPEILAALDRAGRALGVAVAALINIVDVDTVLLGGRYSLLASWLSDRIESELRQRVLTSAWASVTVRPTAWLARR